MVLEHSRGRKPQSGELAVVVGAGRSGLAASRLLRKLGAKVRLLEKNPQAASELVQAQVLAIGAELVVGPHEVEHFENASFIIPSPAMPVSFLQNMLHDKVSAAEIISEMELAWRCLEEEPVLAVTGTSGKTTTASLAAAMLKAQGYSVFLGGNIGTPLSEYILDSRKADAIVLEVSSFQLQGCSTFCPRAAILLNITPNHLDYHKDMREYQDAKFRIFRCQDEGDLAVLNENLRELSGEYHIRARKIWINGEKTIFPEMALLGRHNQFNAEAAWQACKMFGVGFENASAAVAGFRPLPHRLEALGEAGGVLYVNDSKCTTVSSLQVALEAMNRPVRLLCGGKFKGGDLSALGELLGEKAVEVALFGASREHFEKAWRGIVPISWHPSLKAAVLKLRENAKPGDAILLAPATSSFDLYKNYQERGDDFRRIVEGLA